jgi:phosphoglycolate phosphatase-like HAD superfamily hydrolase
MAERDYSPSFPLPERPVFLPGSSIELVRPRRHSSPPAHALFDFDGTLSLIREGWLDIMVPMMVQALAPVARPSESPETLEILARDFVAELTGKQTIYQMMRLADEIRIRGGTPLDPQEYKAEYHERLMKRIARRREGLRDGSIPAEGLLVPGSLDILRALRERGVSIHIASGTDEAYVLEEAGLLGLDKFAPGAIHGAKADHRSFSKEMVIQAILADNRIEGERLVAFGDGYVEISDCVAVGGLAVAVASDEALRSGKPDQWKRERLVRAGADLVIGDYRETEALVDWIWAGGGTGTAG